MTCERSNASRPLSRIVALGLVLFGAQLVLTSLWGLVSEVYTNTMLSANEMT